MLLSTHPPRGHERLGRWFRQSPLVDLSISVVVLAICVAEAWAVSRMWGEVPGFAWIVLGPLSFMIGTVLLLIGLTMFGNFLASLKPTNWLAYVDPDGIRINLRSYQNGHFEGNDPTVVFFTFDEVESARKLTEVRREKRGNETRTSYLRTIELRLDGVDTEPLSVACDLERARKAPTVTRFGVSSSTKHHVAPVYVLEPGVVRVQWRKDLFEAVTKYVRAEVPLKVDLDEQLEGVSVESRARALSMRGQRIAALHLVRTELELDTRAAKDWLADLEQNAA